MPAKLDSCVDSLLADKDFKPGSSAEDRKSSAYAICTARLKESNESSEELVTTAVENQTVVLSAASTLLPATEAQGSFTGAEWRIQLIKAGKSVNSTMGRTREYPLSTLHEAVPLFKDVPVHAAIGPDHSLAERGVKSVIGYVKNPEANPQGIGGVLHISDPNMRAVMLDLHNEGVLKDMMSISIAAMGEWELTPTTARAISCLLYTSPSPRD